MSTAPIPVGYHTVTPYLVVPDTVALIAFLEATFGGVVKERVEGPDGVVMHAEVKIGDSIVMMGTAREGASPLKAMLYVYVDDADAVYRRGLEAGATSVQEPTDQFYGDRTAGLAGPQGNVFYVATHVEDVAPDEMARRMAEREGA